MGVRMKVGSGLAESPVKGYGLTLSAEDILKVATRALAENPTSSASSTGCLLLVSDDDYDFPAIFVRRKNGIRTFYPDATPDPRRNDSCRHPIVLPAVAVNRAPVLDRPLDDGTAPAGDLTEIVIQATTFSDPDGDRLSLTVTLADGGPIPDWAAFDAPRATLLLLPEADQVGSSLNLRVTASDGQSSASDEMQVDVVESTSAGTLVDVDAGVNTEENPIMRFFAEGFYQVEPVGRDSSGAFDAWALAASPAAWRVSYAVRGDGFLLQVLPVGQHPDARTALESAHKRAVFALERDGKVGFFVPRATTAPTLGGVSLRVERICD
jgi:hypothetical protein